MDRRGFAVGDRIQQSADTHPDYCASYGALGDYRFIAASAIGKLHVQRGKHRDDAFAIRSAGPWLAIAVSDGVGSRPKSRLGASFVVEALSEHMLREVCAAVAQESSPPAHDIDAPILVSDARVERIDPSVDPVAPPTPTRDISVLSAGNSNVRNQSTSPTVKPLFARLQDRVRGGVPKRVDSAASRKTQGSEGRDEPVQLPGAPGVKALIRENAGPLGPSPTGASWPSLSGLDASSCGTISWYQRTQSATAPGCDGSANNAAEIAIASSLPESSNDLDAKITSAFEKAHEGLSQFVAARGLRMNEVSCTLLGLLINTGTHEIASGHVGDGLIAGYATGDGMTPVLDAPAPNSAGAVYSFTASDWKSHLAIRCLSGVEASRAKTYFLMTDGVSDDCTFPPPEDVARRWSEDMDRELRSPGTPAQTAHKLLKWLATYDAPSSFDDRTLVAILRDYPTGDSDDNHHS